MLSGEILDSLVTATSKAQVLTTEQVRCCYSYDAYLEISMPDVVVFPASTQEVARVVEVCNHHGVAFVPRGAGTGYAGGSVATSGGVVLVLTDMTEITIDTTSRIAWCEAGAITGDLMQAAARVGLRYPADPSSYSVSTIGGNVATNAGGPHCLGYGVTAHYIVCMEAVNPQGVVVRGDVHTIPYLSQLIGSEGTLGIVTGVGLRLIPAPECIETVYGSFQSPNSALLAMEEAFNLAIVPEAFDVTTGTIHPSDKGYLVDGETVAFIDIEGSKEDVEFRRTELSKVLCDFGARVEVMSKGDLMKRRMAMTIERWRKINTKTRALRYFLFDAVVPRSRVAEAFELTANLANKHNLVMASTFHAGDGNLHPCPFFDPTDQQSELNRARFWEEFFELLPAFDGILSGEHGLGFEKFELVPDFFDDETLKISQKLKSQLDPRTISNPGKKLGFYRGRKTHVRRWERPLEGEVEVNVLDGYIRASAAATRKTLDSALAGTAYELAFNPLGWAADMPLQLALAQGAPSLEDARLGMSRDKFLGGRYLYQGSIITVGSPFAKDVTAYNTRAQCHGAKSNFGVLQDAWLVIRPSLYRSVSWIRVEDYQLSEVFSALRQRPLPFNYVVEQNAGKKILFAIVGARTPVTTRQRLLAESILPSERWNSRSFEGVYPSEWRADSEVLIKSTNTPPHLASELSTRDCLFPLFGNFVAFRSFGKTLRGTHELD